MQRNFSGQIQAEGDCDVQGSKCLHVALPTTPYMEVFAYCSINSRRNDHYHEFNLLTEHFMNEVTSFLSEEPFANHSIENIAASKASPAIW